MAAAAAAAAAQADAPAAAAPTTWHGLRGLLVRRGPFAPEYFEASEENVRVLNEIARVLVVGAGGLGCEILKDLALSGFRDLVVVDLDTIDISNLNRQFLFRRKHVGMGKAEVAAKAIMSKFPLVQVEFHKKKIQEFPPSWYKRFDVVIAGLDNVEARQWLNMTLNNLVEFDEDGRVRMETSIPFIDGGTEGFRGQARLFYPKITSCFNCSLDSIPQRAQFHHCTIATTPRIPEHCIQYAQEILWPQLLEFRSVDDYRLYEPRDEGDEYVPNKVKLDKDSAEHMSWIFNRACERAARFGIKGVTYKLTMQVVKNIIPAVASTNAIIAAACVNEAVKAVTRSSMLLNNYMQYNGVRLTGCELHEYGKQPNCTVCQIPRLFEMKAADTLGALRERVAKELEIEGPDLSTSKAMLYQGVAHDSWAANLDKPLSALFPSGSLISVEGKQRRSAVVLVTY